MTTPDIWTKVEQQGEQRLYTLQTRDFATAQAMRVAPQLLAAAQLVLNNWETGDLAQAVRGLSAAIELATQE